MLVASSVVQVYLQCALLYTTTEGARRVRVSTLALPVSDQMGAVFKGADLDSQLSALTRQVSWQYLQGVGKSQASAGVESTQLARQAYCVLHVRKWCCWCCMIHVGRK